MHKTTLFWDFDGVMANSTTFVFNYWQQALEQAGYKFTMADYEATFTCPLPFEYLEDKFPKDAQRIYQNYSEYESTHYPNNVEPFDGFVEAFLELPRNLNHFVVSSNLEAVIAPWLKKQALDTYFKAVLGRETPKYKHEKIAQIIQTQPLKPSDCVFIGDTTSDINHAHKAGIDSIAVTWGVHNQEVLEKAAPTKMCHSINQLFTLLQHASK